MTDKAKKIREDIERMVPHLARVHGVLQDDVWNEMYIRAMEEVTLKRQWYDNSINRSSNPSFRAVDMGNKVIAYEKNSECNL